MFKKKRKKDEEEEEKKVKTTLPRQNPGWPDMHINPQLNVLINIFLLEEKENLNFFGNK